jgi:putative ABC transport system substrate-binding protein
MKAWMACVMLVLALCPPAAFAQVKTVAVLSSDAQPTTQEARDAMRDGLKETLRAGGFPEGKNLKIQFETATQGTDQLELLAKKIASARVDVMVAMDTAAAVAMSAASAQIPLVFVAVPDPVQAGLLRAWSASGSHITGISSTVPGARQVSVIRQLVAHARKVGVIYNPTDKDSVVQVKALQEPFAQAGLVMIEATVARPVDVGSAARSLIGRVDVIFTFADPAVTQSYAALVKVANDARIPLIASDAASVRQGASGALVVLDRELGVQAGRMVVRILRGTRAGTIAPEFARPQLILNLRSAKKQGVEFSEVTLKSAGEILK